MSTDAAKLNFTFKTKPYWLGQILDSLSVQQYSWNSTNGDFSYLKRIPYCSELIHLIGNTPRCDIIP